MACIFYNKPCVILPVLFARNFMGISERKFRFFALKNNPLYAG